jgi:hypothetical protein
MNRQNIICKESDCIHSSGEDGGCTRDFVIIQNQRCIGFEKTSKIHFAITLDASAVQSVYSTLDKHHIQLEILDFEEEDGEEYRRRMENREAELQSELHKIY